MPGGEVAVPRAVLVAVVVLAASLGSVAILSTLPAPKGSPPHSVPWNGTITYTSEVVPIPANGSGWGPVSNITFGGVLFRLWPEFVPPWLVYLQGTGTEPDGIALAFVVSENNSSIGGNPPPTNASVRTWFSPDGAFGITWLSGTGHSMAVRLSVAQPMPVYAEESVQLNPITNSNETPSTAFLLGVTFRLQVEGWDSPAGPFLNASAIEPNGTVEWLGIWDGPLVACALSGNTPAWVLGDATCLESAAPDHSVALLWDGDVSVTLMVRTA